MRTRTAIGALVAIIAGAVSLLSAAPAQSAPTWAPAATASIHPGVMMFTDGAQCTANFIFTDSSNVYIGYAAHCAGLGGATDTNGCEAGSHPLNTPVEIDGATRPGTLAYSSWLAMDRAGETNENACNYNDFALVRIDPADVGRVNPSVPHWGGPTGLNTTGIPAGETVYSYGNSSLRLGVTQLSPKTGTSLGTSGGGWTHPVYMATPGIPGDSGSGLLDAAGRASGALSTVAIAPLAGSNNFSDLARAVSYMHTHGGPQATLARGTESFNANQLLLAL